VRRLARPGHAGAVGEGVLAVAAHGEDVQPAPRRAVYDELIVPRAAVEADFFCFAVAKRAAVQLAPDDAPL
jgi:hypothetical protein